MSFNKLFCLENHDVFKTCIDQRCHQSPLMCSNSRCKCSEVHKLCKGIYQFQPLISHLIQKIATMRKPFESIVSWYNNFTKQINFERDELIRKMDFLVEKLLDQNESKLLQTLSNAKTSKITGDIMNKIIFSLKKPVLNFHILEDQIKQDINKANKDLQENILKIRKYCETQADDTESLDKVKKCGIKWTWLNGKWIKPVPQEFSLSDLTGLGLDYLDDQVINILASHCPKLQGLQVGYWVTNSNFNDICAQTIATNLPFLKRLWIYNSPLTDKGSAKISTSLKCLQYLILNNCKLTAVGKSEVRRLLPQCKKIQLL